MPPQACGGADSRVGAPRRPATPDGCHDDLQPIARSAASTEPSPAARPAPPGRVLRIAHRARRARPCCTQHPRARRRSDLRVRERRALLRELLLPRPGTRPARSPNHAARRSLDDLRADRRLLHPSGTPRVHGPGRWGLLGAVWTSRSAVLHSSVSRSNGFHDSVAASTSRSAGPAFSPPRPSCTDLFSACCSYSAGSCTRSARRSSRATDPGSTQLGSATTRPGTPSSSRPVR